MAPIIDIVRNGETGYYRDALLSPLGTSQAREFGRTYPFMDNITHIVSAPTGGAVDTCLEAFDPHLISEKKLILLPELQEIGCSLKDTPMPPETLYQRHGRFLNATNVDPNFFLKGPDTRFAPELHKVESRALCARSFIRDLARTAGADAHIVVVTHGAFAHFLTQDFAGLAPGESSAWPAAGMRSYRFAHPGQWDDAAELAETPESRGGHAQHACWAETGARGRARLRGYAVEALERENAAMYDELRYQVLSPISPGQAFASLP